MSVPDNISFFRPPVKAERTGFRHLGMSQKHRLWGYDLPVLDLDFVLLEYDQGHPAGLIEHKHVSELWKPDQKGMLALGELGLMASLPSYVTVYDPRGLPPNRVGWRFEVCSLNHLASIALAVFWCEPGASEIEKYLHRGLRAPLEEQDYRRFLAYLRERKKRDEVRSPKLPPGWTSVQARRRNLKHR